MSKHQAARREQRASAATADFTRAQIADAIDRAVRDVTGTDGVGHCAIYALAGAVVANIVTGDEYLPQAGKLVVAASTGTDDGGDYTDYMEMDPVAGRADGHNRDGQNSEFHAWAVRVPRRARQGELYVLGDDDVLMDLSFHHMPLWAQRFREDWWQRSDWPPYFWGTVRELRALDVQLQTDEQTTAEMLAHPGNSDLTFLVAKAAMGLLHLPAAGG